MSLKASAHSVSGSLRQEVTVDGRFRARHRRARVARRRGHRAFAARAPARRARRLRLDPARSLCPDEGLAARPGRRGRRLRPQGETAALHRRHPARRAALAGAGRAAREGRVGLPGEARAGRRARVRGAPHGGVQADRASGGLRCASRSSSSAAAPAARWWPTGCAAGSSPHEADIHVVDRDDRHVYQPGLLFVPFGLADVDELVRQRRRQLRGEIVFHECEVESVQLERERGRARGRAGARLRRPDRRHRCAAPARGDRGAHRPRLGRARVHLLRAGGRTAAARSARALQPAAGWS